MKKYIPNILTTYRLLIALLIPILFFNKNYDALVILFIIAIISDSLDGALARKWNVTSKYGQIVDMIADKILSILASLTFAIAINKWFIVTLIFEIIIALINGINYLKTKNIDDNKSSMYGKLKTWFLFIALLIGLISFKVEILKQLIIPFIILTMGMQIITALDYLKRNVNK